MASGGRLFATIGAIIILAPALARGQAPPTGDPPPFGSTFTTAELADLPTGGNVYSLLETMHAEVIADRFFSNGLNTGVPARLGTFLGSWTQTQFRIGDVPITDPAGRGSALFWPDSLFWQRITATTGLMPVDANASALMVTLEPRVPTAGWMTVVDGMASGSPLLSAPPSGGSSAIERLTDARAASVLLSGPLIPDRLGLVAAGSWINSSQAERATAPVTATVESVFAHLVYAATPHDEIRTLGWIQLNLSNEVEEQVVSGATFRTPTAVQPPRAVLVGIRMNLQ